MKILKNKKTWDLLGLALGLIILVAGIVFMTSPPNSYSTDRTQYASFGGDYYTYQYDATCVVATNVAVTANNIREIGEAQADYFGFLFITVGALTTVFYGKKFFVEDMIETSATLQEESAVSTEESAVEDVPATIVETDILE